MTTLDQPSDRIATLDIVRGVAVMGILTMNIVAFGMPEAAYLNPRAYGGDTGIDLVAYLVNFVLFDGKMRGLFSFLFGASALLVIERAEAHGMSAARVHYARMAWLLVFGLLHLYLFWWGDILNHYALIGMILFRFRAWGITALVKLALTLIAVQTLLLAGLPVAVAMNAADASRPNATAAAIEARRDFENSFGKPEPKEIAKELAAYRGSYGDALARRAEDGATPVLGALFVVGMETLAYMLLGMALFKSGMLRGEWPLARYRRWLLIGFGVGIPAYVAIGWYVAGAGFSVFAVTLGVLLLAAPVRPLMIVGWASLIILLARGRSWLTGRLAAAGRMAFTNYLMTTILCTTFFNGYGFSFYGYLGRSELYLVVAATWVLILLWSKPWLAHFRYGPFEWLWRSLARGSLQAMRR